MKSGDGFLLVFSLTSLDSIAELHHIWEQIQRIKEASVPVGKVRLSSLSCRREEEKSTD
jgi:hypothetical protein